MGGDLREALKVVAVNLKESGIPFALAGGYAIWARGGPEPDHDVDFVVPEDDAAEGRRAVGRTRLECRAPAGGLAVQGVRR